MPAQFRTPSGFPENLPQEQIVEDSLKEIMRTVCESFGYAPIETPAVEYLDTLFSKGDIGKEIYSISRTAAESDSEETNPRGLRFDLTVPFARYVAQHYNDLSFPFRRYQIQKVWRGERPQKGRFREFYQADVDIIANETLLPEYDVEIIAIIAKILAQFPIGDCTIHVNNRRLLNGLLQIMRISDVDAGMRALDKLEKVGFEETKKALCELTDLPESAVADQLTKLARTIPLNEVENYLNEIPDSNDEIKTAKGEIRAFVYGVQEAGLADSERIRVVLNPSIARGLDYYTGLVFETTINGLEKYGSICSGGRYANLTERFIKKKLPGIGLSIGLTRILSILKEENLADFSRSSKSDLVLASVDQEQGDESLLKIAQELQRADFKVEISYPGKKLDLAKQLDSARKKGIGFFLLHEKDGGYTLYHLKSGSDKGSEKEPLQNLDEVCSRVRAGN